MKNKTKTIPFSEWIEKQMKDPEFKKEYDALEEEYAEIRKQLTIAQELSLLEKFVEEKISHEIKKPASGSTEELARYYETTPVKNAKTWGFGWFLRNWSKRK